MNRRLLVALAVITVVGALLRAVPVAVSGFPLNDGGLFLAMINAIADHWPVLPATVPYNGEALPFGYPPLGFYLTHVAMAVSGMSGLQAMQVVPVALSIATIPAAFALFRRLLDTEFRAVVATAAFAVIPRAYEVSVSGGGVTRALGLLLALMTLTVGLDWLRSMRWRHAIITGLLLALTGLSHPQAGVFAASSLLIIAFFRAQRNRSAVLQLLGIGAVASACVAPWLLLVVQRHGLDTLVGAFATGGSLSESAVLVASLRFSDGLFEVLGVTGIFGLLVAVINRRWLFPVWMVATLLVSSRAGPNYGAVILSVGVAFAVADLVRILRRIEPPTVAEMHRSRVVLVALVLLSVMSVADSAGSRLRPLSPLHALDPYARQAFQWIRDETDPDSVVLVLSATGWFIDAPSEWLPVLTERRSSATVQGSEWLGSGVFRTREAQYLWLQSCAVAGRADCVDEWERVVEPVDYILLLRSRVAEGEGTPCCLGLVPTLTAAGDEVLYENAGSVVLSSGRDGET